MIDRDFILFESVAGATIQAGRIDFLRRRYSRLKLPVLMYHSIVDDQADDQACLSLVGMTIREAKFRRHMEYISENYQSVLLSDYWEWRLGVGSLPENSCVISFDDGLLDVYERGVPILEEFGLKGVIFPIGCTLLAEGRSYIHDLYAILDSVSMEEMHRVLKELFVGFPDEELETKASMRDWASHCFHELDSDTRIEKMEGLRVATADFTDAVPEFMNKVQLRDLTDRGFEIGAHSMNHGFLSLLDEESLESEIVGCKDVICNATGRNPVSFCFPFGVYDPRAVRILKAHGFCGAVTMSEGLNDRRTDLWQLRRIRVTWDLPENAFVFRLLGLRGFLWTLRRWLLKRPWFRRKTVAKI